MSRGWMSRGRHVVHVDGRCTLFRKHEFHTYSVLYRYLSHAHSLVYMEFIRAHSRTRRCHMHTLQYTWNSQAFCLVHTNATHTLISTHGSQTRTHQYTLMSHAHLQAHTHTHAFSFFSHFPSLLSYFLIFYGIFSGLLSFPHSCHLFSSPSPISLYIEIDKQSNRQKCRSIDR